MNKLTGFSYTESLHQFLWRYHRDIYALVIMFGHNELLDKDLSKEYFAWIQTDEAKPYLEGGELYKDPH